jgi:hypothetical protein
LADQITIGKGDRESTRVTGCPILEGGLLVSDTSLKPKSAFGVPAADRTLEYAEARCPVTRRLAYAATHSR